MFASKDIFLKSSGGYQISRSVRLRSSASAYFNRTPASAGNRRTWTWSGWVKLGVLGTDRVLFSATNGTTFDQLRYSSSDNSLQLGLNNGTYNINTSALFRDPSSWYHVLFYCDTTNATSTERMQIWVNGVRQAVTAAVYPTLNYDTYINSTNAHQIGRVGTSGYFDGYLTEINFIDGQALDPSYFGFTDSTGIWQPSSYTGQYGTNGFYLNFSDNSSNTATTIGKDYSGNGNNWTPNNISVTAGVTYDSMIDSPTVSSVSSNYAVLNPIWGNSNPPAFSNANLTASPSGSGYNNAISTIAMPSTGYWYAEFTATANVPFGGGNNNSIGLTLATRASLSGSDYIGKYSDTYGYLDGGGLYNNNTASQTVASYATNDVIMVAFGNGKLWWGKNGTWLGTGSPNPATATSPAFSGLSGDYFFALTTYNSPYGGTWAINFGQRPFTYTPPTGFVALNTQNLPTPTISNGATVMAATTYTGTGSALTIANTVGSASFQPDLVWVKGRSGATDHAWYDAVRGVQKQLESNNTGAETTETTGLTAFGSTGFTVGALAQMNTSAATYVAWQWNAGGSTVTNTSGSISSQVRANATAGFSVVTYTGTGANATVGHGLSVAPKMIIVKNRDNSAGDWAVYHASLTSASYYIKLNLTAAQVSSATYWNSTAPTSTVFTVGTNGDVNQSTQKIVAYCFAAVAGYSAFGSYTGNGSTDGPFVFTNFRPRWVMIKRTDAIASWYVYDTSRATYNTTNAWLQPDTAAAENSATTWEFDLLSNGFKVRNSGAFSNASGGTYIYVAFAEVPFRYANAR